MTIILEKDSSFSKSMVWTTSRNYYIEKGVEAWSESVPFYITSNAFIAKQYADVLLSAMQSWVDSHPSNEPPCFPILEIGAGCGQLAFLIIRSLNESMETLKLKSFSFQYIISDLSAKNLAFISDHALFAPFISNNQCRFSVFDLENNDSIELLPTETHPAETLTPTTPLLLVANYLFDSLTSDVFYVKDGNIQEAKVSLSTKQNNLVNGSPKDWEKVSLSFSKTPITDNHYDDDAFNNILNSYKTSLDDTHVIFPIGSLNALKRLKRICQQPLMVLLSDKCFNDTTEMQEQDPPELDVHGSFSTMVNLDALTQYCLSHNGHSIIPTPRDGLTTTILTMGINPEQFPLLNYNIQQHLERFNPTDFFNLYDALSDHHSTWNLEQLSGILSASNWDPGLFSVVEERLQEALEKDNTQVVDYVLNKLALVGDQFYPIPAAEDVYFQMASIYYALDHYETAISYFERSLDFYPNEDEALFNLGLCYLYLDDHANALVNVKKALAIDPKNETYLSTYKEIENSSVVPYN